MKENSNSKKIAKKMLLNNFPAVCVSFSCVLLFSILVSLIISFLNIALADYPIGQYTFPIGVILTIFFLPIFNGFFRICYKLSNNNTVKASNVFHYFSSFDRYFDAFTLNIFIILRVVFVGFIALVPFFAFEYCRDVYFSISETYRLYATIALITIPCLFGIAFLFRYFFVLFIYEENNELNVGEYFRKSSRLMRGNKIKLLLLLLSFIPWILLCFFVIPIFFVIPYMVISCCIFGLKIIFAAKHKTKSE